MKQTKLALALAVLGLQAGPWTRVSAQSIVVPNSLADSPGSSDNRFPFAPFSTESVPRYQQVHGAAELVEAVGRSITGMAFRLDELDADVPPFGYGNIEIRMSTTDKAPDQLAMDLDQNVGADEVVVYDGPYQLPVLGGSRTPNPFDLAFDFDAPFPYVGGNLLFDVRITPPTPPSFYLDSESATGDGVSRVYETSTTTTASTLALVVELRLEPGPSLGVIHPMTDCGGAPGKLAHTGGEAKLGHVLKFELDDGQTDGVTAYLAFALDAATEWPPCGADVPGFGEVLFSLSPPNPTLLLGGGVTWQGAPVGFQILIPDDTYLLGLQAYAQGLFVDLAGAAPGEPFRTTGGFELAIGA
ncbi:MAG: hypothetical protein AAF682_27725 [Planctomycetota bacterium]